MEIKNCRCGRKARMDYSQPGYHVKCTRFYCWTGPERKTEREAIKAWNRVMEKKPKYVRSLPNLGGRDY